jgi:hypothetical protein
MAEPDPRDKFWVVDPPAVYEDEENGTVLLLIFTTRGQLLHYFRNVPGLPKLERDSTMSRRYGRLKQDIKRLGWSGIVIDPNPTGGESRIIRFDGVAGTGPAEKSPETSREAEPPLTSSGGVTKIALSQGSKSAPTA